MESLSGWPVGCTRAVNLWLPVLVRPWAEHRNSLAELFVVSRDERTKFPACFEAQRIVIKRETVSRVATTHGARRALADLFVDSADGSSFELDTLQWGIVVPLYADQWVGIVDRARRPITRITRLGRCGVPRTAVIPCLVLRELRSDPPCSDISSRWSACCRDRTQPITNPRRSPQQIQRPRLPHESPAAILSRPSWSCWSRAVSRHYRSAVVAAYDRREGARP